MLNLKNPKKTLLFNTPFKSSDGNFSSGLFTGNGSVGVTVFGEPEVDTVVISNSKLTFGGKNGVLPDAFDKIKQAKKLALDNKLNEANKIAPEFFANKNYRPETNSLMPLCFLKVKQNFAGMATDYKLSLNMETSEISLNFDANKTNYDRSVFVHRASSTIFYEINKQGGEEINCELALVLPENDYISLPFVKLEDGTFTVTAKDCEGDDFGAVAKIVLNGGTLENKVNHFKIKGADRVLILVQTFAKSNKEKFLSKIKEFFTTNKFVYDKYLKETAVSLNKILGDYNLDLGTDKNDEYISSLIDRSIVGKLEPALLEKLWNYGRFLIACSGSEEPNVMFSSGIFALSEKPCYNILKLDGSLERVYNTATSTGIKNIVPALADYYENYYDDLKKNAMRLHGARGIFVPDLHVPNGQITIAKTSEDVFFISGAAYVSLVLYNEYIVSGDVKFLKTKVLPFMRDVLYFFEDFFKIGKNGLEPYVAFSGNSPLNFYNEFAGRGAELAINTTMEVVLVREILNVFLPLAKEHGLFKTDLTRFSNLLDNLKVPENSGEFYKEFNHPAMVENFVSPSVNYMMPLIYAPQTEISRNLYSVISNTAIKKLISPYKNARTLGDIATILAITKNSESINVLDELITKFIRSNLTFSYSTKFAAPNLFSLDVNAGVTTAISNLVLNSTYNSITVNTPNVFNKFSVVLPTKCFCDVSVEYVAKTGLTIKIKSKKTQNIKLYFDKKFKKFKGTAVKNFDAKQCVADVSLAENKVVSIVLN